MANLAEAPVFVPQEGIPIYKEWANCSGELASRLGLPLSVVTAHIIERAGQTPDRNAHIVLLQTFALARITSQDLVRASLMKV